jgi:hypothetical protein
LDELIKKMPKAENPSHYKYKIKVNHNLGGLFASFSEGGIRMDFWGGVL